MWLRYIVGRVSALYVLYATTIFLSAFLLFAIQPIEGKNLLPFFGGSSSVWATSLLFFTGILFVGYTYVYLLTTYAGKRQSLIHGFVVILSALAVLYSGHQSLDWTIGSATYPAWNVLVALFTLIGAPYFLLSTTGPLLQYWYGLTSSTEPYKLYALSNAGSLIALVGYIFLIEPFIQLSREMNFWTVLFFVYVLMVILIVVKVSSRSIQAGATNGSRVEKDPKEKIGTKFVFWIGYAALPSLLLLATTTTITQTVAPVPLLWIVPLMLYLITLILAFAGFGRSKYVPLLVIIAAILAYIYRGAGEYYVASEMCADLSLLFLGSLLCHARLYSLRPSVQRLPLFYLFVSFGGVLGILCGSMIAPLIFTDFWEFPLCVAILASVAVYSLPDIFFPRIMQGNNIFLTKIVFCLVACALFLNTIFSVAGAPYSASRNFYGAIKVLFEGQLTVLMHGATVHGYQVDSDEFRYAPSSYYIPDSGVGRAMLYEKGLHKKGVRVGTIGLGTGSVAAYCKSGDTFVFYEIDPRIVDVAHSAFSYLRHCSGAEVRVGDGRLLLESELRRGALGRYDLMVIDAFADDTVPVHLLTEQAIQLYAAHLNSPQSIIAVHTSNKHMDLPPVILKIAEQLRLSAKIVTSPGDDRIGSPSVWVLLAKDPKVFDDAHFSDSKFVMPNIKNAPLWTDDYTSLLSVLRI